MRLFRLGAIAMDGGNFVYNIISVLRLIDKNIAFKWQKIVMHQTLKYFFKLVNRFLIKNISCHILLQHHILKIFDVD